MKNLNSHFRLLTVALFLAAGVAFGRAPQGKTWYPKILKDKSIFLPDYSYAGYHWGEVPIPNVGGTVINVTDYGARPNDNLDDTRGIEKAIAAADKLKGNVIVYFPKGKYIVSQIIWIDRGHLVLRGAGNGPDGTVLYMPDPMEKMNLPQSLIDYRNYFIKNNKRLKNGKLFSIFSWRGGILWTKMNGHRQSFMTFALEGKRGSHDVFVKDAAKFKPGSVIEIQWFNRGGKDSGFIKEITDSQNVEIGDRLYDNPNTPLVTQPVTVEKVAGNEITLKEKLLLDVKPQWKTRIVAVRYLSEVGIEDLSIEFPDVPYAGHHSEAGYNAIYLTDLVNSWVKNVTIKNADSGILSDSCKNVTLDGITTLGRLGHYSVHLGDCDYMLLENFRFDSPEFHSPSFNTGSELNVCTHGEVFKVRLDQHCGLNMQNLYDDMRVSLDNIKNLFKHGGAKYFRPTAGAFNTFWKIYVDYKKGKKTGLKNAPSARIIGMYGNKPIDLQYGPNAYIEGLNEGDIAVPSLYKYQLDRRLDR